MAARVRINGKGVQELLASSGVRRHLRGRAERVLSVAKGSAPVESGAYAASLHVEDAVTDRPVSRVVADVPYATSVESRHRTLGSALDAARE